MNDLQKPEPAPLAQDDVSRYSHNVTSPMALMQSVIAGGITPQNVEVFGKLLEYQREMESRDAEKQFNAAFVALQFDMPTIRTSKEVVSKGVTMYMYAPFEDIMAQLHPFLKKHGFAVTFSMDFKDARIISQCTLLHVGGHSKSNQFSVRAGKGPPNASEAQADGACSTYAKRFALCNALNIVISGIDDDARNEGDGAMITEDQADLIRRRVGALKMSPENEERFYVWACGAKGKTFVDIPAKNYIEVDKYLTRMADKQVKI